MTTPAFWSPPSIAPRYFEACGLVLRAYESVDAAALHEAIDESRATLLPWLPWAKSQHLTVDASRQSISLFNEAREKLTDHEMGQVFGAVHGAFCAQTGTLLGGAGLVRINSARHTGEIGYWVRESRRREGVATRACAGMLSWCFTPQERGGFGLRRVVIFAAATNVASCGVPARLGLHRFAEAREEMYVEGFGWSDSMGWDVLAEEWDLRAHSLRRARG